MSLAGAEALEPNLALPQQHTVVWGLGRPTLTAQKRTL